MGGTKWECVIIPEKVILWFPRKTPDNIASRRSMSFLSHSRCRDMNNPGSPPASATWFCSAACLLNKLVEQGAIERARQNLPFFGSLIACPRFSWIPQFASTASLYTVTLLGADRSSSAQIQPSVPTIPIREATEQNRCSQPISSLEKYWSL